MKPTIAKLWTVKDIASHLLDTNIRTISLARDQHLIEPDTAINSYQDLVDYLNQLNADWVKATKRNKKFTEIIFGIVPEFQRKGVDAFMIMEAAKVIQEPMLYDDYEMQWIGDFNPKMMNVAASLGTHISRKLITYRYIFDRTKEFKRHPVL